MAFGSGRTVDKAPCSDADAKALFRDEWKLRPTLWKRPTDGGPWLRVRPNSRVTGSVECPDLTVLGMTSAKTEPDALYIAVGPGASFVDVIAVEHCSSAQNFFDKRSRYAPTTYSRAVRVGCDWLKQSESLQGGGNSPNWQLLEMWAACPGQDVILPIRHLRVLYALRYDEYIQFLAQAFNAHEFLCLHSSLKHWANIRKFLTRMSMELHFYSDRV